MDKLEKNEVIDKEIVQDKVENQNKVEPKLNTSKKAKQTHKEKICDVLVYNAKKNTAVISFDGYGYEIKNVKENPGDKITVKYTGDINSRNFRILS